MFNERYTSRVEVRPGEYVKALATDTRLFSRLVNEWHFKPGPTHNSTTVDFVVEYKFHNSLYAHVSWRVSLREQDGILFFSRHVQVAGVFQNEIVSQMMPAFEARATQLFGRPHAHQPSTPRCDQASEGVPSPLVGGQPRQAVVGTQDATDPAHTKPFRKPKPLAIGHRDNKSLW